MHRRQREVCKGKNVGTDIDRTRLENDDGGRGCRHACPLIFLPPPSAIERQTDEAGRPADDGQADGRTGPEGEGGGRGRSRVLFQLYCLKAARWNTILLK